MQGQVAEEVKSERLARLQALLDEQRHGFDAATVGKTVDVLFEKPGRHQGQIIGKSPYLQAVFATGAETLIGQIVPVRIEAAAPNSLQGAVVSQDSGARAA